MEPTRPEDASPRTSRRAWLLVGALAAAYVALHAPTLADFSRWHGDERFYVDSALDMRAAGDWTTALYPDGRPRYAKPILVYWIVGASHAALGVSLASSRLPFLLAGAGLVLLAFATARRLLRDDVVALAAAALVFANPQLAALSTRATPDVFVCLGTGLCLHGVARALGRGRAERADAAFLWLGAGLGVAAKGGLGLVAPAFALTFLALRRDASLRARDLVHAPSLLLGALVATVGVTAPMWRHGSEALAGLVTDQVGDRVESGWLDVFVNALVNLRSTLKNLLPWSALLGLAWALAPGRLRETVARARASHALALSWWALLVAIFAFGATSRGRYLAPATILLCAVVAHELVAALRDGDSGRASRVLAASCLALVGALGAAGLVLVAFGGRIDARLVAAGAGILAASGVAAWSARGADRGRALVAAVTAWGVAFALVDAEVRPVFSGSEVETVAAELTGLGLQGREIAVTGGSESLATKLRIASGGRLRPVSLAPGSDPAAFAPYAAVVASADEAPRLVAAGWTARPVAFSIEDWDAGDVRGLFGPDASKTLEGHRVWIWVATRAQNFHLPPRADLR